MKPVKFFSMAFAVLFSFGSAFALPSAFNTQLSAAEKTSLENGQPVMIHGRRKIGAWGRNGVKITFRFSL